MFFFFFGKSQKLNSVIRNKNICFSVLRPKRLLNVIHIPHLLSPRLSSRVLPKTLGLLFPFLSAILGSSPGRPHTRLLAAALVFAPYTLTSGLRSPFSCFPWFTGGRTQASREHVPSSLSLRQPCPFQSLSSCTLVGSH